MPNGGQSAPQALTKTYGEPLLLPEELPLWAGHRFLGWNTRSDGTGDSYAPGARYLAEGDAILYAQWADEIPNTDGDALLPLWIALAIGAQGGWLLVKRKKAMKNEK